MIVIQSVARGCGLKGQGERPYVGITRVPPNMFRTTWCYIALDGFWGFSELHYCTCGWLTNVNFVCVICLWVWIWSVMAFWWWVGVLFQWIDLKKFVGGWFCIGSSYQMFFVMEKWRLSVLIFFYIRCALYIHPLTTQCTFKSPKQPKIKRTWALERACVGFNYWWRPAFQVSTLTANIFG